MILVVPTIRLGIYTYLQILYILGEKNLLGLEKKEILENKALKEKLDPLDPEVTLGIKAFREKKEKRVTKEIKAKKAKREIKEIKELKAILS